MVDFSFIFTRKTVSMRTSELTRFLEELAPLHLQESYDNAGLLVGSPEKEIHKALVTLDVTDAVLVEAREKGCDLIIAHHPLIFGGLKKLTGSTMVERLVVEAIKADIAIYALHTNLDNVHSGVNRILGEKLGLTGLRILAPKAGLLRKLVTFCPVKEAEAVRTALFGAGAGQIGEYDSCSFNLEGTGSFRGSDNTYPFVGEKGKLHHENEIRIETIYPVYKERLILNSLFEAHPYEEVAYDIYPLQNEHPRVGAGMIGLLQEPLTEVDFLNHVKKITGIPGIRHSALSNRKLHRVAFCGGAGSFLIKDAIRNQADVFLTGDIKYHDFFLGEDKMLIADIGHYESEKFVKELIYSNLIEKFSNFAVLISEANTNSVNYL